MVGAGRILLAAALALAVVGVAGGVASMRRPEPWRRLSVAATRSCAVALVAALAVLGRAFAIGDYSVVAVADHSRRALGTYDRVMGLWGGMAGSLLLFTSATAVFAAIGLGRRPHPLAVVASCGLTGSLVAIGWWLADPFETLQVPALDGVGLTPILEHWAMRIHPPLVYAGLTALVVPAARTLGAMADRRLDASWWASVRSWLVAAWMLLAGGMLLGAHWAYVELGWGGYWAWDPVENAALLPWLATTIALHAGSPQVSRVLGPVVLLPFGLALLGTTLTRSGATTSVHAFAEARGIGRALVVLLVAFCVLAIVLSVRAARVVRRQDRFPEPALFAAQAVLGAVLAVVLAGTLYPLLSAWSGGERVAVEGRFFSGTVAPLVVLGLLALIGRGRRVPASGVVGALVAGALLLLAGWRDPFAVVLGSLAVAVVTASGRSLVRSRRPAELAHLGLAVFLFGVAGTATGEHVTTTVAVGEAAVVDGHRVVVRSLGTQPGPTASSTAVVVDLLLDGHPRRAALVAHPDRGVLLAESTLRSTPASDVQVILRDAIDDRAVLTVNVAPLQQVVWWGALLMILGGMAALRPGPHRSGSPGRARRERLLSSSAPSVEAGGAVEPSSVASSGG